MDELVAALKAAIVEQEERAEFIKRGLAALNEQGLTYDEIAHRVGVTRSKAQRLAKSYR